VLEDLAKIQASSAHSARQLALNTDVKICNEIDAIVG
jgi:hypothetical protein